MPNISYLKIQYDQQNMKLILLMLCTLFLMFVSHATQVESFTVPASTMRTFTLNLNPGDNVSGSIAITGGNNDVDFTIKDPQGTEIYSKRRIQQGTTFSFTASQAGAYTLVFGNSFSILTDKVVQITYAVTRQTQSSKACVPSTAILLLVGFGVLISQ
jgi:hypothetical protein